MPFIIDMTSGSLRYKVMRVINIKHIRVTIHQIMSYGME